MILKRGWDIYLTTIVGLPRPYAADSKNSSRTNSRARGSAGPVFQLEEMMLEEYVVFVGTPLLWTLLSQLMVRALFLKKAIKNWAKPITPMVSIEIDKR